VNAALIRNLDLAEEQELRQIEKTLADRKTRHRVIRHFLEQCDESDLAYIAAALSRPGGAPSKANTVATANPDPNQWTVRQERDIKFKEYPPITYRGTPRRRSWGVLGPAVLQAIDRVNVITAPAVFEWLNVNGFQFVGANKNRNISSVSSFLRTLETQGELVVIGARGKGVRPVRYEKKLQEHATTRATGQ
jgi:hypothetical protein